MKLSKNDIELKKGLELQQKRADRVAMLKTKREKLVNRISVIELDIERLTRLIEIGR